MCYVVLVVVSIILVYPFFNMVMLAFMSEQELSSIPLPQIPASFSLDNFKHILDAFGYYGENGEHSYVWTFLLNTVFVLVMRIIVVVLSCTLCAFGFSKIKFPGRNVAFAIVMATVMIPSAVTMIPLFTEYRDLGWLDTLKPLWIPAAFGGGAMNIFLMRQYMRTLPDTLTEAAKMDGAGYFRIYWNIILPNCKPMMFFILISAVNSVWGDYFTPYLYINSKEKWTVPLAVANMAQSGTSYDGASMGSKGVQMAVCVVVCIVPLITFVLGQKNYVENVTLSGVKG